MSPPPVSILTIKNLLVERGGARVLDIPAFSLSEGETLAIIGPNGAGKTTFFLAIARLLDPVRGTLLFKGRNVLRPELTISYRRRLAMVFQDPLLLNTTVFHNVAVGLKIRHLPKQEIARRVARYADMMRIGHLLNRSAKSLSGGEAQRTNLARAFATEPEIILLDEPFANLDAPSRDTLIEDLRLVLGQTGTTAIVATHDRLEALRLADRLAVMNEGHIVQTGACQEVMNHPANELVASFVGIETLFPGIVQKASGGTFTVEVTGQKIEGIGEVAVGETIICCVRPENVIISRREAGTETSVRNNLPAMIIKIIPQGPYFKLQLDCGFFLTAYVMPQSLENLALKEGKRVNLSFKATAVHAIRRGK